MLELHLTAARRPMLSLRTWLGSFGSSLVILLSGILTGVLSARWLLPEGRGALASILTYPQLLGSIGILSIDTALINRLGAQPARARELTSASLLLALVLSLATGAIGWIFAPWWLGPERDALLGITRGYTLLFIPLWFLSVMLLAADLGRERYARFSGLQVVPAVSYLLLLLGLGLFEQVTVEGVVLASLISQAVALLVRAWGWRFELGISGAVRSLAELLSTGGRFHVATVISVLARQGDRVLLIATSADRVVGLYAVALTVSTTALSLVTGSLGTILAPAVARQGSSEAKAETIALGLRTATPVSLLIALVLGGLCPWVVPALFGAEFEAAVLPTQILLAAHVPICLRLLLINGLRGFGLARAGTIAEALALGVMLALGWGLGTAFGMSGLAAAVLASGLLSYGFLLLSLRSSLGLRWWDTLGLAPAELAHTFRRLALTLRKDRSG